MAISGGIMKTSWNTWVAVSLLFLADCNDPNAANADNFRSVLQHYYDVHPVCIALPISFPLDVAADEDEPLRLQIDALAAAGLLSQRRSSDAGVLPDIAGKTHNGIRYDVAPAGEKFILGNADSFIGGMDLCFASRRIVDIVSFSPPVEILGMKATQVSFTYELKQIAPWARTAVIEAAFPQIKAALEQTAGHETDGLVLTNSGWRQERELQ